MAAANSDQENVLLQSDEGSPSAPPPAGRLPFKAALAVGLCVFAAGLAGAVMMGRPAARAPINIWHQSAIGLSEHEFKHMTKECTDLLDELEKEAVEEGRTNHDGALQGWVDCKDESEQACTIDYSVYGIDIHREKCFPAVCKEANIFKELDAAIAEADDAQVTGLEVSCDAPEPEPESDHEFKHMTKECVGLLEELEKEAEEMGRTHEVGTFSPGTLDCKEESEQACTVEVSMYGVDIKQEKCFPAVCKEDNIFKEMEATMAEVGDEAQLSGLVVSCSGGEEDAKSRAGQCGPEVGLLGASVLVASIFAQ